MQTSPYTKAGLLALVLLVGFLLGWEAYLRQHGFALSYNDDEELWAVGSSRVDLQACKLEYSIVSPK